MVNSQGAREVLYSGNRAWRYELTDGRAHVHLGEIVGALLKQRVQLKDDCIIIAGGIYRCHLPRSERIVKRGPNLLRCEAEGRRLLTIDVENGLWALDLQIRRYVLKPGQL